MTPVQRALGGPVAGPGIAFLATRAAVLAGHKAGVARLGMVGMGTGYGGLGAQAAARAMVEAIEKEKAHAYVPPLPWTALAPVMKHAPLPLLKRLL